MAALQRQTGGTAAIVAVLALLTAAPVLAQSPAQPADAKAQTVKPQVIKPQAKAHAKAHVKPHAKSPLVTGSAELPMPVDPALLARAQAPGPSSKPASNPFAALLGRTGSSTSLNPEQRAIIGRINGYLSSVQNLQGKFVQVGPDGRRSQGDFYISKPGRVRFEYDDPSPIELIADGSSVVVRDRKLATQDVYPLSQTPLRFLLADKVDLMKDSSLTAVYADDTFVTAVLEENNGLIGKSRLMIMFNAKDMQLKQWTVTDPQGYDTTVAVYNLDTSKTPDPSMFKIDYTRYR